MNRFLAQKTIVTACVLFTALAFGADDVGKKTFMWKATSPTNTVYLLGSIHIGNDDFYPLAPEIESAFADSKNLVVEVNINDPEIMTKSQKLVMEKGRYQNGDSLSTKLSKKNAALVETYCEKNGLPFEQAKMLRPWLFGITVTMMKAQSLGFKPDQGIDKHFLALAKDKKPIKELETFESQLGMLAGFTDDFQEMLLIKSLDESDGMKEKLDKLISLWKTGDDKGLEDLMVTSEVKKHPEILPVFDKTLYERNVGMADKIAGYLKGDEKHFVVVGSGHLFGEKGIVALLAKKGFKVEQVSRK